MIVADPTATEGAMAKPSQLPPLTPEQQRLVTENQPLVGGHMKRFRGSWWVAQYDHDPEEGHAQGMLGLIEAARRFDPSRGFQFSTCAFVWIRNKMQGRRRNPRDEIFLRSCRDIDYHYDGTGAGDNHPADPSPDADHNVAVLDALEAALACLTDRERDVLIRRARGETLDDIGKSMDLTKERIRQIQEQAMRRAREAAGTLPPPWPKKRKGRKGRRRRGSRSLRI